MAAPLGILLAESIEHLRELPDSLTVIPVPLHAAKERQRGFNQTALLANSAVRSLRRRHPEKKLVLALNALARQRSTESQSALTKRERRLNLRGAFFVAQPKRIEGGAILLLDDIYTTGATARECTKALLAGGAATVFVATLARSQREGVVLWDSAGPLRAPAHTSTAPSPNTISGFA